MPEQRSADNLLFFESRNNRSFEAITVPTRGKRFLNPPPRKRHPIWLPKQTRVVSFTSFKNDADKI